MRLLISVWCLGFALVNLSAAKHILYEAKSEDTLPKIAKTFGVSESLLKQLNPNKLEKGSLKGKKILVPIVEKPTLFHLITETDNDYIIAQKYGISLRALHQLNPDINWNRLKPGRKVLVPNPMYKKFETKHPSIKESSDQEKPLVSCEKSSSEHSLNSRYMRIQKRDVVVRSRPDLQGKKLLSVKYGALGRLVDRSGRWYLLKFEDDHIVGWVRGDMLSPAGKSPSKISSVKGDLNLREISKDNVLVHSSPSLSGGRLSMLDRGCLGQYLEREGEWVKLSFSKQNVTGWVHESMVRLAQSPAQVNLQNSKKAIGASSGNYKKTSKDNVVVRARPSYGGARLSIIEKGESGKVLDHKGAWWKLNFSEKGISGWVHSSLLVEGSASINRKRVSESEKKKTSQVLSNHSLSVPIKNNSGSSTVGKSVVDYAKKQLGVRYRWSKMSRGQGFDCSGLTAYVYKQCGIHLPHQSLGQSRKGAPVDRKNLRQGDLVFFRTRGRSRVNHCGVYIGNGKFVHASSGCGRVTTSCLNTGYYARCYAGARRVS